MIKHVGTKELCTDRVRLKNVYNWAIEYNREVIGGISGMRFDEINNSVEIGYCIGHSFWNKGITTEAMQLLIDFFFNQVGVHRIMAKHDIENPASGKVMQKCHMKYEGRQRDHYLRHDGTYSDAVVYGLLEQDLTNDNKDVK